MHIPYRRKPEHEWTIGRGEFCSYIWLARPKGPVLEVVEKPKTRPLIEVIDFFVHPERRGKGWATRLMGEACAWADACGAALVLRACAEGRYQNTPRLTYRQLKRFYNKYGFRTVRADPEKLTYEIPLDSIMVRQPKTTPWKTKPRTSALRA